MFCYHKQHKKTFTVCDNRKLKDMRILEDDDECFHWYRHQPYHVLMKMIGADDNLGKAIQCQIAANSIDSDKWKAVDWMEWQAKGVAPRILMPARPTRLKADQLLAVYGGADDASIAAYENVIDELAELFDVSRQAAKVRLMDLGCSKAEGAYPFVDGQYVRGYSFEAGALDKNQTFTIPYADLFKAYCFDREFKKLIDSGQFKQGEILPTIRDADGFVKQVRLEDMALTPNLTQSLNNLSTHAVMAQILDEIEYVGDAIREIHVELQNDRLAMAEGARDKLIQARLIQDAKLREAAMLDVIHSATDAKRVLMRNFSQNMYHITEHSQKSDFQMMLDFKGEKDISRKAIDAFQALVYITNSVQTECEGYAMLGEYEPCKECLEEFKSFILENRLNERDTLLLLNENSSQKRIEVVDQFTDIAARITAFDPKAHIEYSVHNLLTAETEHTGGDSDEQ